ncbi:hypothetical protein B0H14DRAFT_2556963 [Mycena olivaceomarginata]|nr:hypothetical protein B0H14DRAFT_2556963 [Mycena olivaceomarginata]
MSSPVIVLSIVLIRNLLAFTLPYFPVTDLRAFAVSGGRETRGRLPPVSQSEGGRLLGGRLPEVPWSGGESFSGGALEGFLDITNNLGALTTVPQANFAMHTPHTALMAAVPSLFRAMCHYSSRLNIHQLQVAVVPVEVPPTLPCDHLILSLAELLKGSK